MAKIKAYLECCVADKAFPGASWVIGNAEGVFEKGSVGILGTGLGPVQEDSIYDMASITKLFVALAAMKQFEEGLLRLEDTVDYFLPSFNGSPFGGFTIFELMTHTAPIPGTLGLYHRAHTKEEMLEIIRTSSVRQDPPGSVLYTCEAFMLMGEIISAIDSASLDNVIRKRVWEPLGMKDTCYKPPASLIDRIAPTEYCSIRDRVVRGEVHDENAWVMGGVSGNAGIFSCAQDMAKMGVAMLDSLEDDAFQRKAPFLHKATAEIMCKNHTPGVGENRGLGWMIATRGTSSGDLLSPRSFGHTGFTGTSLWIDPDRKFYALLLTNRVHPTRENTKLFRTRNIFHNLAVLQYGDSMPHNAKQGNNG